jgi:hypothetical protein
MVRGSLRPSFFINKIIEKTKKKKMSRITGSDAQGLMEAYAAVYAPQEITEEQIWEEVEVWVNSLVEEGYDLSEYTWEDMYEEYLKEYTRQADRPGQTPAEAKAAEKAAKERGASAARAYQAKADAYKPGGLVGGVKDLLRALPKGQGKMDSDLGKPDSTVKPTTAKPTQSALAGKVSYNDPKKLSADAAKDLKNRYPQNFRNSSGGDGGNGRGGSSQPPTAKQKPTFTPQSGNKAKDMATWAKANPTLAAKVTPAGTQKGTGQSTMAKQAAELRAIRPSQAPAAASSTSPAASGSVAPATSKLAATPKPTPVAPNRATGSKKPGSAFEQFDAYDVVLEYLLDNGHADTVDEAHYVMMEMDGETIADIFEGRRTSLSALSRESQQRKADKERGRPETKAEIHGRLMLGKFRPSASPEERAEGGRERLKDRGKVPKKGGKDMFEQVLEHLISEGYAETEEAAIEIIANMSEEWKQSIVEQSAIASRAAAVVDDQRRGSHGMAHDQKMTGDSIKKLNRYKGPRVTPGLPGA